ncbi:MAG: helix-turn-helix domain-containing protein [Anaerostipes sp.]|nr:helix-turn-helix domain-containing protein [Anaerostipes sp.]
MISNQMLQDILEGIYKIVAVNLSVYDLQGRIIAQTSEQPIDDTETIEAFVASMAESQVLNGKQYFKVFDDKRLEYVLLSDGEAENSFTVGKLAVFQIERLLIAYKERFDKENFVKNLLLDNLLLVDIYNRAKKLKIDVEQSRVALLIEATYGREQNLLEIINELPVINEDDFVTAVDEKSVVLISETSCEDNQENFIEYGHKIQNELRKSGLNEIRIAIGTVAEGIREVSRSYKEAQIALEVDKIFYDNRPVVAYSQLGIGRLIYQLPLPLCKMYIREVFKDYSPKMFDEETLTTIYKFFENNLNVSETSRQLYIHRNTLVYRLDKIQKTTNLDLRNFEDAIAFRIALMVVKYMEHMETEN